LDTCICSKLYKLESLRTVDGVVLAISAVNGKALLVELFEFPWNPGTVFCLEKELRLDVDTERWLLLAPELLADEA